MKNLCGVLAGIAFLMTAGFLGGMELGTLTVQSGFLGAAISLLAFVVLLKIGGVIE